MLFYRKVENNKSKDWVVFLHGLGGNHQVFYKQMEDYEQKYNLLFIDFPGHGESHGLDEKEHTTEKITEEIYAILDKLYISKFHIVGFSLGTIIAQEMISKAPTRIQSVVLAGAVIDWNWWSKQLATYAYRIRHFAPYMTFYKAFALLMMPKKNHKRSRDIFIREALKLGREEFFKWAKLALTPSASYIKAINTPNTIPKLLVMGEDDHMFIDSATKATKKDPYAELIMLKNAGHVCIIEQAKKFNQCSLDFLAMHEIRLQKTGS